MAIPKQLTELIGVEQRLDAVNIALRYLARDLWMASFHDEFVRGLLPDLKFLNRSAFRTSNLGARYEQGALAIAEDHYAGAVPEGGFKLLLVKLHSHVSVVAREDGLHFGEMVRYGQESAYCGALLALLRGDDTGYTRALHKTFSMGGLDRLTILRDPTRVDPTYQPLFAAIVNTLLQAERVQADIGAHEPEGDTVYVIASSVTLNRATRDTELLCGLTLVDCRDGVRIDGVRLGTDPSAYAVFGELGTLRVTG